MLEFLIGLALPLVIGVPLVVVRQRPHSRAPETSEADSMAPVDLAAEVAAEESAVSTPFKIRLTGDVLHSTSRTALLALTNPGPDDLEVSVVRADCIVVNGRGETYFHGQATVPPSKLLLRPLVPKTVGCEMAEGRDPIVAIRLVLEPLRGNVRAIDPITIHL